MGWLQEGHGKLVDRRSVSGTPVTVQALARSFTGPSGFISLIAVSIPFVSHVACILPHFPVLTMVSPCLSLRHPRDILMRPPPEMRIASSPQSTKPTTPDSSRPQAAATFPGQHPLVTCFDGYRLRISNSMRSNECPSLKSLVFVRWGLTIFLFSTAIARNIAISRLLFAESFNCFFAYLPCFIYCIGLEADV